MKTAAERRAQELTEIEEADRKSAMEKKDRKMRLRRVQERDKRDRQDFMNRQSELQKTIQDFNDVNIMSFVFQDKHNKTLEYDEKKQANISKIIEKFPMESRINSYQQKLISKDNPFNPTQGPSFQQMSQREMDKKKKAIEAK